MEWEYDGVTLKPWMKQISSVFFILWTHRSVCDKRTPEGEGDEDRSKLGEGCYGEGGM